MFADEAENAQSQLLGYFASGPGEHTFEPFRSENITDGTPFTSSTSCENLRVCGAKETIFQTQNWAVW